MQHQKTVADYPELVAQWHPIKNGDLKPCYFSHASGKRIWWKCFAADDHEWEATINTRKKGHGCPCCSGRKTVSSNCLATVRPDIAAQWHPIKNGKLTPHNVVAGSDKKIWWKCPVADDHEWKASISGRNKNGCPCCSNHKLVKSNSLSALYPQLASQWHPIKNGNLHPTNIIAGSHRKIWWKCPVADDHEWESSISARINSKGCPCCSGHKTVLSNCLGNLNLELCKQWHPTKNGKLTPYDVTIGSSNRKVWWKCSVANDHEWEAKINDRQGHGCPCCDGKKAVASNSLATTNPEIAVEWHPIKNGSLTPNDVVEGSRKKVWWKCPVADDHEWKAMIGNRTINNSGCPCCDGKKAVPSNSLATTNPEIAVEWHPIKNGSLTPNDVVEGSRKKVWWKCDEGHVWHAAIYSRNNGNSCPICKESRGEKKLADTLKEMKLSFVRQHKFKTCKLVRCLPFDIVVKTNISVACIEYQGEQHYLPKAFGSKQQYADLRNLKGNIERDHKKIEWCRKHKILLLLIPYWDFDRISEILDDFFAGRTPTLSEPPKVVTRNALRRQKIRERLGITEPEVLCGLIINCE